MEPCPGFFLEPSNDIVRHILLYIIVSIKYYIIYIIIYVIILYIVYSYYIKILYLYFYIYNKFIICYRYINILILWRVTPSLVDSAHESSSLLVGYFM